MLVGIIFSWDIELFAVIAEMSAAAVLLTSLDNCGFEKPIEN